MAASSTTPPDVSFYGGAQWAAAPVTGERRGAALVVWRNAAACLLAANVVIAMVLRCHGIANRSLWFDEAFSWRVSHSPVAEVVERCARDNHPPLYFLALKGWRALFGDSSVSLRGLSVFSGALAVIGVYLLVREAWPRSRLRQSAEIEHFPSGEADCINAGSVAPAGDATSAITQRSANFAALLAAALVAVNAFQVRWGWEARMYALGTALAALSSWAMFRALHARLRVWRAWSLYGLLALLFAYTHVYALFSIAAQFLFLALYAAADAGFRPSRLRALPYLRSMLGALALFVIGFLPWVPCLAAQRAHVRSDFWTQPVGAWDVPNLCYHILALPENGNASKPQAACATAFCAAVLLLLLWRPRAIDAYLVLAVVIPLALSLLVSAFDTRIFCPRYFVFAGLFFCAAAARLVGRIPDPFFKGAVGLAMTANALAMTVSFEDGLDFAARPGMRVACQYIKDHGQAGEPVVVAAASFSLPARYHLGGEFECHYLGDLADVRHYQGAAAFHAGDCISAETLASLPARRIWAINNHSGPWAPETVKVPERWTLVGRHEFREAYNVQGSLELAEYVKPPQPAGDAAEPSGGTRQGVREE